MLGGGFLFVLCIAYVALLFAVAWFGDRLSKRMPARERPYIYSLALAVYCTSWTFYGAVGTAATSGWAYLPIYLGPILLVIFGAGLLRRIIMITRRQSITSIADFIASRYGKARSLAVLVTVMVVIGTLPYIALQLKAVSMSFDVVTSSQEGFPLATFDTAFYVAIGLALFAILFGTRQLDASEHRHGLMLAVAFESVIKLGAFIVVGWYALNSVFDGPADLLQQIVTNEALSERFLPDAMPGGFLAQTVLAMVAIFTLPRQFQVMAVENSGPSELRRARWVFPLYLAIFSIFVIPIAAAGITQLPAGVLPDTYVLALPAAANLDFLTLVTFLGGFSAATAMVIVASVALSTMVSNEIVLPLLFRLRKHDHAARTDYSKVLLVTRAATISLVLLAAWAYYRVSGGSTALAAIGLLSFAMAAQLAPPVLFGVYWKRATRRGAIAGLLIGFFIWADMLLFPALDGTSLLAMAMNLPENPGLSAGVTTSLLLNTALLVIVSLLDEPSLAERLQAAAFSGRNLDMAGQPLPRRLDVTVRDLEILAARFLGEGNATRAMSEYLHRSNSALAPDDRAERHVAQFTERLIAGAIGSASARMVMTSALSQRGAAIGDVMMLLDETSEAIRFNRSLLEATLENISQGISVVDVDLRLVGWNRRYEELLDYPAGFLYIGRPVADLIRLNAERGMFDSGPVEEHIEKRLSYMRAGSSYRFERERDDGQVLEIRGNPLPGGGFVTTYSDISEYKAIERALRESEENVRFYTDNAPAMLVYVDEEFRYRFANKAYCEYLGRERDEIIGRLPNECLPRGEWEFRKQYMERAMQGERQNLEMELTFADGRRQYALGTYIPHYDDKGKVVGLYAIFQDITSRRTAELELQEAKALLESRVTQRTEELTNAVEQLQQAKQAADQANQTKTRFLAAASHDLLQPMNAASLFTSVLTQKADERDPELAELARRVADSLAAAEDILGALLDISKLDAGAMKPEPTRFRVSELLSALERQFSALAQERGLSLKVRSNDHGIYSDRQLLRRVLQNFLTNALRYTPRGGKILLAARKRGEQLEISVWDTGPGIAEEHRRAVFEEFRRLDSTSVLKERGLGLGLAIADRIARMLGLQIDLASSPGRGSRFSVAVPLSDTVLESEPEAAPLAGRFDQLDTWCIDNEESILAGMRVVLERWGCEVRVFESASALRNALNGSAPPAIILADYHLGGPVNGLDLVIEAREHFGMHIPGIVITADRSEEVAGTVRAADVSLLQKPMKPAALRAAIAGLMGRRKAS